MRGEEWEGVEMREEDWDVVNGGGWRVVGRWEEGRSGEGQENGGGL